MVIYIFCSIQLNAILFLCVKRNQVAFTPTQVEAIRAGMHYGLTMVLLLI